MRVALLVTVLAVTIVTVPVNAHSGELVTLLNNVPIPSTGLDLPSVNVGAFSWVSLLAYSTNSVDVTIAFADRPNSTIASSVPKSHQTMCNVGPYGVGGCSFPENPVGGTIRIQGPHLFGHVGSGAPGQTLTLKLWLTR